MNQEQNYKLKPYITKREKDAILAVLLDSGVSTQELQEGNISSEALKAFEKKMVDTIVVELNGESVAGNAYERILELPAVTADKIMKEANLIFAPLEQAE